MFQKLLKKIKKATKRRGRGYGSARGGHTVGYGQKGQKSRGRGKVAPYQEGGNIPMSRRIPKFRGRGFTGKNNTISINIAWIVDRISTPNVTIDKAFLRKLGYKIPETKNVRLYGTAEFKVPVKVSGITITKGVKQAVEKANSGK